MDKKEIFINNVIICMQDKLNSEQLRELDNIIDQYLTTVKPMHYLYIEPTKVYADIVINSGMNDVALDLVAAKITSLLEDRL